jgi:hypothetical protein
MPLNAVYKILTPIKFLFSKRGLFSLSKELPELIVLGVIVAFCWGVIISVSQFI